MADILVDNSSTHSEKVHTIGISNSAFKSIAILDVTPHGAVIKDVEWGEMHPIGGCETATMNMAACFQRLGYAVEILTDRERIENHRCDIFISNRRWDVFEQGRLPGRLNYLWCHDDVNDIDPGYLKERSAAERIYDACDGLIFLSHYQQRRWIEILHAPIEKCFLSTNGVPVEKFYVDPWKLIARPRWAYYSSTPFRGLDVLLEAWPIIRSAVEDAELHVFSSMKVYNESDTEQYEMLYDVAKNMEGVHYHAPVGQSQLRLTAQMCRVLAYPCTFPETSCITALEAMAAGCVVAGTNLGALPETAWHNPLVPMGEGWIKKWIFEIVRLLMDDARYVSLAKQNIVTASYYAWSSVAARWLQQFELDFCRL